MIDTAVLLVHIRLINLVINFNQSINGILHCYMTTCFPQYYFRNIVIQFYNILRLIIIIVGWAPIITIKIIVNLIDDCLADAMHLM